MKTTPRSNLDLWALLVLVLAFAVGSYWWMSRPRGERSRRVLMAMVSRVTNSVNPHALQRWAVHALQTPEATVDTGDSTSQLMRDADLVRLIPTLGYGPPQSRLCRAAHESTGESHIAIVFPGGFGSWGLRVGAESYRADEGDNCYGWIPGVYIINSP